MKLSRLLLLTAIAAYAQKAPDLKDTQYCPNTPDGRPRLSPPSTTVRDLHKIVLNSPGAICNDGTPATIYVRPARAGATEPDGSSANRWLIHIEGGGSCTDFEECIERWCGLGFYTAHQMSSTYEDDYISRTGLLNRNGLNRLADRNLVMLNYCSSDGWGGRKSGSVLQSADDPGKTVAIHFQGATIVDAAFDALEKGVTGMPRLTDATDVLISGDSGGANGVRVHLDRLAERLKPKNAAVRVRGNLEATFFPDVNGKQGFPAGDPRDPVFANKTERYQTINVGLYNSLADASCVAANPGQRAYLCADGAYVELNHITTPFFQIQDMNDPGMLEDIVDSGGTATPAVVAEALYDQLAGLANIRNTAVEKASINFTPGAVARLCGVHVTWGDDDGFFGRHIRTGLGATAYSYYELLWNWMTGATPSTVLEPRPPSTPTTPVLDPICNAKAPTAPPPVSIATESSASYDLNGPVAPESIAVTFGTNLASTTAAATTNPFPTTLGGIQVTVMDSRGVSRLAPLNYVSPTQLLYLIPAGTANGTAQITIGSQRTTVEVATTAPGIYTANQGGTGVAAATYVRITSKGVRTEDYIFNPLTGADAGVPAAAGDQIYLILYGTGLRGGPATATVGGVNVPVIGPLAQGQFQGLDQINFGPLPLKIGLGQKQIVIRQGDQTANIVTVSFHAP